MLLVSLLSLFRPAIAHMPPTAPNKALTIELGLGITPSWIMDQDFLSYNSAMIDSPE